MAALVQTRNAQGNAQTSASLAYNSNVTVGSTLILIFTYYVDPDFTVSSVANSNGSNLTSRVGPMRSDIDGATKQIFSLDNASAGATTLTVNISGSGAANAYSIEIFEVSWTSGPGSYIDGSMDNVNSATVDPGNVDNTVAEAFLICASTSYFSSPSAASGWTAANPGDSTWFEFTQYRIVSSIASWSTAMGGSVDGWVAVAAAFQGAGGGGGGTTRGTPFGHRGTAFNGGRTFHGIIQ